MRSGTHLLIDLILNNFPAYRRDPLYLNIDTYLNDGLPVEPLWECGAYVVKTHHPQMPVPAEAVAHLRALAEQAVVVRPVRPLEDVLRSLHSFGEKLDLAELERIRAETEAFWRDIRTLEIPFAALADSAGSREVLAQIADRAGLSLPPEPVPTPSKEQTGRILRAKLLTRLLGHRAPRVNTTIQFDSTRRSTR